MSFYVRLHCAKLQQLFSLSMFFFSQSMKYTEIVKNVRQFPTDHCNVFKCLISDQKTKVF